MKSEADDKGRFGQFGGRYVPETLIAALDELSEAYPRITAQSDFSQELTRCSPATPAGRRRSPSRLG